MSFQLIGVCVCVGVCVKHVVVLCFPLSQAQNWYLAPVILEVQSHLGYKRPTALLEGFSIRRLVSAKAFPCQTSLKTGRQHISKRRARLMARDVLDAHGGLVPEVEQRAWISLLFVWVFTVSFRCFAHDKHTTTNTHGG